MPAETEVMAKADLCNLHFFSLHEMIGFGAHWFGQIIYLAVIQ